MNFDQTLQVKQFVACVKGTDGGRETGRFMVLETGSPKHYLFVQLDPRYGTTTGVSFPVEKKRLRDDVRRALAAGRGNCGMKAADDGRPFRFLPPGATWAARTPAPEEKMTTQTTRPHDDPDRYDRLDALLADRRRAHQEKQEAEQGHALLRQQLEEARGRLDGARAAYHAACAAIDAACAAPEAEQRPDPTAPGASTAGSTSAKAASPGGATNSTEPSRARVVCTADDLASVDGGPLWHLGFLPACLKRLSDQGRTAEVLPHTQAQAARAREAVAAQGLGGAVVVLPAYEGRCGHCGRDVGAGHEPGCPYHVGPQTGKCSVCGQDRPCPCVSAPPAPKKPRRPRAKKAPEAPPEPPPGRAHEWHEARGATCCRLCGTVRRDGDAGACPGRAAPSGELFAPDPMPTPTAQTEGA